MRHWMVLTLITLSSQVWALSEPEVHDAAQQNFSKTCSAKYASGNFAIAIPACQRAAIKGDQDAQTIMGKMFFYGHGVISNNEKAVNWFRQSASQGDSQGQFFLGRMYSGGLGVELDRAEAFKHFMAAAKQGDSDAQWLVSMAYHSGIGTPKDAALAFEWYESAIQNGLKNAQPKTREDFQPHYHRIDPSHPGTQSYQNGITAIMGVKGFPNHEEALPWFIEAANLDHTEAQYNLGLIYFEGNGVGRDDSEALRWFTKAAEQGHRPAQGYLAWMHFLGMGTLFDSTSAMEWYMASLEPSKETKRAQAEAKAKASTPGTIEFLQAKAKKGDAETQTKLGLMYLDGDGVPQDRHQGFKLIHTAAYQGYPLAEYHLGLLYLEGEGVIQNREKGIEWLRRAASHNQPNAHYELGLLYYNGLYVKKSYQQAYAWFNLAAGQDIIEAQSARSKLMNDMSKDQIASAQALSRELYQQLNQ